MLIKLAADFFNVLCDFTVPKKLYGPAFLADLGSFQMMSFGKGYFIFWGHGQVTSVMLVILYKLYSITYTVSVKEFILNSIM